MVNQVDRANLLKRLESRKERAPTSEAFLQQSPVKRLSGSAR
jgi:hypothetical protein